MKPKIKLINNTIKESDIVIIDLNTTPVFEADQIITQLKDNFNVNTTIIILSNLMTWFNTPLKKEKENENSDDQVQSDIEDKDKADDVNTLLKELYGESIDFDQDKVKWIIQNIKKT